MRDVFNSLAMAYELTQEQVAERSGGMFNRVLANKVATGKNQGSSERVHAGLAHAFGLSRDELANYVSGRASLAETIRAKEARVRAAMRKAAAAEVARMKLQLDADAAALKRIKGAA